MTSRAPVRGHTTRTSVSGTHRERAARPSGCKQTARQSRRSSWVRLLEKDGKDALRLNRSADSSHPVVSRFAGTRSDCRILQRVSAHGFSVSFLLSRSEIRRKVDGPYQVFSARRLWSNAKVRTATAPIAARTADDGSGTDAATVQWPVPIHMVRAASPLGIAQSSPFVSE